jgi:hypothetical protein
MLYVDFDEREQDLDDVQRAKAELSNFARTLAEGKRLAGEADVPVVAR